MAPKESASASEVVNYLENTQAHRPHVTDSGARADVGVSFAWKDGNDVGVFRRTLLREYGWAVTSVSHHEMDTRVWLEPLDQL